MHVSPTLLALTFAGLLIASTLVRLWLATRQMRHVIRHRSQVPAAYQSTIDAAAHQKAADYTVAKTRLSVIDIGLQAALLLGWTLLGGLDALNKTLAELQQQLPPGVKLTQITDGSRQIRVSVSNVRQTLLEGALLTVLIVFLFLNSWRSTVITGLTLPIALIGTFFFMNLLGFTINMITMMALSLCVGLLIDDAIVVRENIVRHVQLGKGAFDASMDGTREIGLAVFATTLSIVAVFLPIGFMGGIIGKFFHEFGLTIVAAVLISMFVSFTLDPMLSSIWHDPSIEAHGQHHAPRTLYDKTIGRITALFDHGTDLLVDVYQGILRWALDHKLSTVAVALLIFVSSIFMVPLLGTEFVPKSDFSETNLTFNTPVGSSLEVTEARARQVEGIIRSFPEVNYTLTTINTGNAQGKMYASIYIRLVDRNQRSRSVDEMSTVLRQRLREVPGISVTHVGLLDPVGGQKQIAFSIQGADMGELSRLNAMALEKIRAVPGLVDIDSSLKPDKPTLDVQVRRDAASDLGLSVAQIGASLRTLVAGQTVGNWRAPDDQTYDVNVRLAPEQRARTADLAALNTATLAALGTASLAELPALSSLNLGTDASPELAATCVVGVPSLAPATPAPGAAAAECTSWVLEGPGIAQTHTLHIGGISTDERDRFQRLREANHGLFPRGVDVLLTTRTHVVGLPRTTRLTPLFGPLPAQGD